VLSIGLGVAVVIAIDLAGDAATGSFQSSLTTLVGKVDYEITANAGIDQNILAKLNTLPINARFSPMIEQPVVITGHGATMLYGIDTVAALQSTNAQSSQAGDAGKNSEFDPTQLENSAVVSKELATRLGWSKGSTFELRGTQSTHGFTVREVAADETSSWIGVDIEAAGALVGAPNKLDRLEIFLGPDQNSDAAEKQIRAAIPSTWDLETPGARSEENRRMLRAFRWNLRVLSYISLLVGAFLIYNTVAVSVVRRRTEIGILRAIGVTARGVLFVFLGESLMLGLAGAIVGIALGRFLAGTLVGMLSQTVNALFVTSTPGAVDLGFWSIAGALGIGTAVAVLSAWIPAREAARVAPAEAMRRAIVEHEARIHARRDLIIAALCAVAAYVLAQFGPIDGRPILGYVSSLLAVASAAMVSPSFVNAVVGILRKPLVRFAGAEGLIAGRSLVASLARTSIIVTALATAIAMMISVAVMVGSFRETVQVWLESQLRADIYLRAAGPPVTGVYPAIAAPVEDIIRKTPGVAAVDVFHAFDIRYQGLKATFGAGSMDVIRRYRTLRFLSGDSAAILASLPGRNRAIVSEPFSAKHHIRVGDVINIPLGTKTVPLTVAGIYYDYSSDRGFVIVDRSTLLKVLPDQPLTNIAVYVTPGADKTAVRRILESRLQDYPLQIAPNDLLRRQAIEVFDRTFTVTYALEAVAIVVAMLGAANSLLALVLDRRREIGLIRFLGAATGQVRRMILMEAGLLGLLASLLGLALGMALSLVLIYVVNKQSFGWTIQFHPPVLLLAGALLLVWAVTVLAGVYPARFAARLQPVEVVHEE